MERDYDVVLLDVMLTTKSQIEDKVEGLSTGAGDYTVMRRYKKENNQRLSVGGLTVDLTQMSAYY